MQDLNREYESLQVANKHPIDAVMDNEEKESIMRIRQ